MEPASGRGAFSGSSRAAPILPPPTARSTTHEGPRETLRNQNLADVFPVHGERAALAAMVSGLRAMRGTKSLPSARAVRWRRAGEAEPLLECQGNVLWGTSLLTGLLLATTTLLATLVLMLLVARPRVAPDGAGD